MLRRNLQEKAKRGGSQCTGLWQGVRQLLAVAVVAAIISGGLLVHVKAAIGSLDTTFSGDGKQTTTFGDFDIANAIAIQADGKIVVAGSIQSGSIFDFALARYNTNGTLDTTFSGDGKQTTDFFGFADGANGVAIQSDGKIVVAGSAGSNSNLDVTNFAVARYNTNGTLDATFSGDGKQTTDFSGKQDVATAIVIQPNGKIVLAGFTAVSSAGSYDFALVRYNTNGTLDTTFSGDGKQTTNFGDHDIAEAIAIQPNGKIVAAGAKGCCGSNDFAVARYNGNGTLDTTFSFDGKQTTDFGAASSGNAVAIQSDGKIVVAGYVATTSTDSKFALVRYNGNGSFDDGSANDTTPNDSFGTNGLVTTNFFSSIDVANAVAIQTNGQIVVAGYAAQANDTNHNFALARYDTDGTLDTTFSGDGKQNTGFSSGSRDEGHAVAIQADGKIVVAGYVQNGNAIDFALARYLVN